MCTTNSFSPASCKNLGGIRKKLYYIPVSELTANPATSAATKVLASQTPALGDELIWETDFTKVTTVGLGYFRSIDIHVETGEIKTEGTGNPGEVSFKNTLDFTVKGMSPAALQLGRDIANCCAGFVFIIEDRNGSRKVLGRVGDGAFLTAASGTTGVASTDRAGVSYTITTFDGEPPMELKAGVAIDTTPNA